MKKSSKITNHRFDVSIIFNTHHEGRMMQASVRSLSAAIDYAVSHQLRVELIVVVDRPDEPTRAYVAERLPSLFSQDLPIIVRQVDFGDLGLSRNFGIDLARGDIIGTLDADDLFGANLIADCVTAIRAHKNPVIAHPEYVVSFGRCTEIWRLPSSNDPGFDLAGAVAFNPWPSLSFAPKHIWQDYPCRATHVGVGFGPEDWQWNIDTLGGKIVHVVAPKTAFFYRRKVSGSLAGAHVSGGSLLHKTKLLRDMHMKVLPPRAPKREEQPVPENTLKPVPKTIAQKASVAPRYVLAKTGKIVGPMFRRYRRTQAFEHYMRAAFGALLATTAPVANREPIEIVERTLLPDWLLREWREQHVFEHALFPDEDVVAHIGEYKPYMPEFTKVYWSLLKEVGLDRDYVFIIPWLKIGGADLVVLHYIQAILAVRPDAAITVIATELSPSPWRERLPESVRFVALNESFCVLPLEHQVKLLGTLLIQSSPRIIHLVNSAIGYSVFREYARPLSTGSQLFVSAFNVDRLPNGKHVHYILESLTEFVEYVHVLTDNQYIINMLSLWQALPTQYFSVNYQPYAGRISTPKQTLIDTHSLKVLWAGRLDRQKRPDVLLRIAAETERTELPIEFHVYGSEVLDDKGIASQLDSQHNITYHGGFDKGLEGIGPDQYDVYLMTSEYEGLPNVLLEATAAGLPIIAPSVGGVPEFIRSKETGYLIERYDDVAGYIRALRECLRTPAKGRAYALRAQILLSTRHTWQSFTDALHRDGYLGEKEGHD